MIPFMAGSMWAKRDSSGTLVWACHCDCHIPTYKDDNTPPRPPAVKAMLCEPCFEDAFTPWTQTLEAML